MTCYECGCDPDASWWSQRPRPTRAVRWRVKRALRPLQTWWYAPALHRRWHPDQRPDRCWDTLRPLHDSGMYALFADAHTLQPWEYVDPNPMPAFSLWHIWPGLPAARPHPGPWRMRDFLPSFTAERGSITYNRVRTGT